MNKTMPNIDRNNMGFTLLEIIITITVSAILAVVLVQFLSGQTDRSWRPVQNLNRTLALQSAMDQITSDYRNLLIGSPAPLVDLQSNVTSGQYWPQPQIQVTENYCLDFAESAPGIWNESNSANICSHPSDTMLKITLSFQGQTLTSLFSR